MIISHKHKFIFIKTRKTAGTSIEIALSKICESDDIITPITKKDEEKRIEFGGLPPQNFFVDFKYYNKIDWIRFLGKGKRKKFYNHMPAHEVVNYIPKDVWDSYFKFAFERNPWDKFISWYYWKNKSNLSFSNFFESKLMTRLIAYDQYAIGGLPVVDKIYKYENLTESLEDISRRINLKDNLELPVYKAKGNMRKSHLHYSEELSRDDMDKIALIFAREIKLLKYKFDIKKNEKNLE